MTDGHYPDGDPYGRGVTDEVYGTGANAAYPAYDSYDTGANAAYGDTSYDSGAWQTGGYDTTAYTQSAYPAEQPGYDSGAYNITSVPYATDTSSYGTTAYDTPSYDGTGSYDYDAAGAYDSSGSYSAVDSSGGYPVYDSGAYQAASYDTSYGQQTAVIPQQTGYDTPAWSDDSGTAWSSVPAADMWSGDNRLGADAFSEPHRNDSTATGWYEASTQVQEAVPAYDGYTAAWDDAEPWHNGHASDAPTQTFAEGFTGSDGYDATQEFAAPVTIAAVTPITIDPDADAYDTGAYDKDTYGTDTYDAAAAYSPVGYDADEYAADGYDEYGDEAYDDTEDDPEGEHDAHVAAVASVAGLSAAAAGSRAARRKTTRRTRPMAKVAGASLGVLGATAMAVAAAGGIQAADKQGTVGDETVASGPDVPLASPLDQQFTDLRDSAADFADRASRTQARIALQERQEEIARQQEEERKKREQLRPKYVLPVAPGLSAYFGQAGGRWSNLHTGIDFPVDRGTPVRAVTDGVVRTEFNRAYGNMVILTAPDGTETWYCHLTRAKVVSGPVKAGDVIAYSGNSGNSTGPHLHLEVRPNGGAPINPIPWLRARGLDPTG